MNLLILFIVCNIVNVILNTIKSLVTIKCGKTIAGAVSAITYGFYTYIIILTNCDLELWVKCLVVALCNFLGVYVVKFFEEKARKDRLWKIEFTINCDMNKVKADLDANQIQNAYEILGKHTMFRTYATNKDETKVIKEIINKYGGKYFITETKNF